MAGCCGKQEWSFSATRTVHRGVGDTPEEAVEFQLAVGPAGEVYREAGDLAAQRRNEIVGALNEELARHETAEGVVLDSSTWLVSARNPE